MKKKKPGRIRLFFRRVYRVISNSISAFVRNEDSLKASALTYYTLVSIVPFLAVTFGIAAGFGFEQYLETELKQTFEEQGEAMGYIIQFARSLLQNVKGSVIAGVGLIALLWTNISMLASIENALNTIWNVRTPRTWAKKFTDYLAVMIICPLFFVVSSSVSVFVMTRLTETAKDSPILEFVSPYLQLLLKIVPFLLSVLVFVVIYLFIPNAKVNPRPRIFAGIVAGIAFQLWQWIYIRFQVEISNYGAVYGTFAALPLFLIWLQVSWLILLAGAELAAHIENETAFLEDHSHEEMKTISQKELGLLVLNYCILAYTKGNPPPTSVQLAKEFGVSLMEIQQIVDILEENNVLVEVSLRAYTQIGYQPSKDAHLFTIKNVCDAFDQQGALLVTVRSSRTLEQIDKLLKDLDRTVEHSPANIPFDKIISDVVA